MNNLIWKTVGVYLLFLNLMPFAFATWIARHLAISPHPSEKTVSPTDMSGISNVRCGSSLKSKDAPENSKPILLAPV